MTNAGFLVIKGEVFPYDVLVCLGTTGQQILKYTERKFVECFTDEEKNAIKDIDSKKGYTLRLQNNAILLWTRDFPHTPEQFGYLMHEIFHASDLTLRRAGCALSDDSDEVWAYQIEWLTERIFARFHLVNMRKRPSRKR